MIRFSSRPVRAAFVLYALLLAACGTNPSKDVSDDPARLLGVWEARVDKPFDEGDPEQYVFEIAQSGGQLVAHACTMRRSDGVFDGDILSFDCESESVPVVLDGPSASVGWPSTQASELRLTLQHWKEDDVLVGECYVMKWQAGNLHFEATRIDPSLLP
jgi:hypothetical protein